MELEIMEILVYMEETAVNKAGNRERSRTIQAKNNNISGHYVSMKTIWKYGDL